MSAVTFNAFVVSLATTAAVHFGDIADPLGDIADPGAGRRSAVNLDAAGHAIEMLVLLEEKTCGNLTDAETAFLRRVISELRTRFLDARQQADLSTTIAR